MKDITIWSDDRLETEVFVLECKDHWTPADWEWSRKLQAERERRLTLLPKQSPKSQYKLTVLSDVGELVIKQKWFIERHYAEEWALNHNVQHYTIEEC